MGITIVVARMYAVVIHTWCETPPSSPTMVGMAVDTIVWSRLDSSIPAMRAEKMIQMRRCVSRNGASPPGLAVGRVAVVIRVFLSMRSAGQRGLRAEEVARRADAPLEDVEEGVAVARAEEFAGSGA